MRIQTKWSKSNIEWIFDVHAFTLKRESNELILQFKAKADYKAALLDAQVMFDRGTILAYTQADDMLVITLHLYYHSELNSLNCVPN